MTEIPANDLPSEAIQTTGFSASSITASSIAVTRTAHALLYLDSEGGHLILDPYAEPGVNDRLKAEHEAAIAARGPVRVLKTQKERYNYMTRGLVKTYSIAVEDLEPEKDAK